MKKAFVAFGMLLMTAPAHADITSRMSTSVQLNVDAAATQVERMGNSYSVSGTNIDVTTFGGMTDIDADGVAVFTEGSYDVTTGATSFSFTETATMGDSIYSTSDDSLSVGSVNPYSNQTSTAGGIQTVDVATGTDDDGNTTYDYSAQLGGTITAGHGVSDLSAGGAGTSAIGQFVTEITVD